LVVRYLAQIARLYGPIKKLRQSHEHSNQAVTFDTTTIPTTDGTSVDATTTAAGDDPVAAASDDGTTDDVTHHHHEHQHTIKENMHASLFLRYYNLITPSSLPSFHHPQLSYTDH
jgi:hypothetical protein